MTDVNDDAWMELKGGVVKPGEVVVVYGERFFIKGLNRRKAKITLVRCDRYPMMYDGEETVDYVFTPTKAVPGTVSKETDAAPVHGERSADPV